MSKISKEPTKPRAPVEPIKPKQWQDRCINLDMTYVELPLKSLIEMAGSKIEDAVITSYSEGYESSPYLKIANGEKNPRYAKEMIAYERQMVRYQKELTKYNTNLEKYKADLAAWQAELKPIQKRKLKAEIRRLQKSLKDIEE